MVQHILERVLIDGDDRQTQREWAIRVEGGSVYINRKFGGEHMLLIRVEDVPQMVADLLLMADLAKDRCEP